MLIKSSPYTLAVLGLLMTVAIASLFAQKAIADGGVFLGATTLLNSGDTTRKLDLVFLGDGFTADQQDAFNERVLELAEALLATHPIKAMPSAFNIHRINVSSPESGTDTFSMCDGEATGFPDSTRRTAMDSGYCQGGIGTVNRCMLSSDLSLATGFAANAPDDDIVIVLVNDSGHGGCALGGTTFMTLTSRLADVFIHELGHSIFDLADEYNYGREDTYTGVEPWEENITIATEIAALKWSDLVITSSAFSSPTSIPTQTQPDCSDETLPLANVDDDIVGTFEGSKYRRCGIYRSEHTSRMRNSDEEFNAVGRREIIRILSEYVDREGAVIFNSLLVKNDHDGWATGKGDIYINYKVDGNRLASNRWPTMGNVGIGTGDTKTMSFTAGIVDVSLGVPVTLDLKVRDSDLGTDDKLRDDTISTLPPGGVFEIVEQDYTLKGRLLGPVFTILFDTLNIKNDHDPFSKGDIYVKYKVSNGSETISGRWPKSGDYGFDDHQTRRMNIAAGTIVTPDSNDQLRVSFRVMDEDLFFDDELGHGTFAFVASDSFGADKVVHVQDQKHYRLTMSIVGPAPAVNPNPTIID